PATISLSPCRMSIASHLTSSTSRSLALSFLSIVSLVSVLVELDNIGLPLVGLDHGEPRGDVLVDAELLHELADSFLPFLTHNQSTPALQRARRTPLRSPRNHRPAIAPESAT